MSLKLFRSTGYSSILLPGETRVATHPAWLVAAVSLWIGVICNIALWRTLASGVNAEALKALAQGLVIGAVAGVLLSLLGWRRTLKFSATVLLLLAALLACAVWLQPPPATHLLDKGLSALLPAWTSLLRWQVGAIFLVLALPPMVWLWSLRVRRLPGPEQLGVNIAGVCLSCGVLAASSYLLSRGLA